jgi:hypothetical protein
MFVLANFLFATAQVIDYVLWAYLWILVARFVISRASARENACLCRRVGFIAIGRMGCHYLPAAVFGPVAL